MAEENQFLFDGDTVYYKGKWQTIRSLVSTMSQDEFSFLAKERAKDYFLKTHKYCGICGATTETADDKEIPYAKRCSDKNCVGNKNFFYPTFSIAILVAITRNNGQELLLAHNTAWINNTYSVIAGFLQTGETLEQCVIREVDEEINLHVKNLSFFSSQPWPFPSTLLAGFFADSPDEQPKADGREIDKIIWINKSDYKAIISDNKPSDKPNIPRKGSISRKLIDTWGQS